MSCCWPRNKCGEYMLNAVAPDDNASAAVSDSPNRHCDAAAQNGRASNSHAPSTSSSLSFFIVGDIGAPGSCKRRMLIDGMRPVFDGSVPQGRRVQPWHKRWQCSLPKERCRYCGRCNLL